MTLTSVNNVSTAFGAKIKHVRLPQINLESGEKGIVITSTVTTKTGNRVFTTRVQPAVSRVGDNASDGPGSFPSDGFILETTSDKIPGKAVFQTQVGYTPNEFATPDYFDQAGKKVSNVGIFDKRATGIPLLGKVIQSVQSALLKSSQRITT